MSRRDESQLKAVYREHGQAMTVYATRLLNGDTRAAEDVVQEVLFKLWRGNMDVLTNGKGSVRGWLLTVVRNTARDRHRTRSRRPQEVREIPEKPPIQRDHADSVLDALLVHEALEKLSPEHREVLQQAYLYQRPLAEIARRLDVPLGTVKSRVFYASRQMRALLDSEPATPR